MPKDKCSGKGQRRGRVMSILIGASGLATAGGILLLGLPGALIYEGCVRLIMGRGFGGVKPDAAWPIALLVSVFWPWGMPAGYFVAPRLFGLRGANVRGAVTLAIEAIWICSLCGLLSYLGA